MMISVIIVNWNGMRWLKNCLDSIYSQSYKNFEVIVVDNASEDESVDFISNNYPSVKIVQSVSNLGFAGGNNLGIKHANGQYYLLINTDTISDSDLIRSLLEYMEADKKIGVLQPKLLSLTDSSVIDSCGSFLTITSLLYHYGVKGQSNLPIYNDILSVFSCKGACMLIRKSIVDTIGLFDDRYWCYYEETDFCHRVIISGYKCLYYPIAKCQHYIGGSSSKFDSKFVQYHNSKNRICTILKNFDFWSLPYFLIATLLTIFLQSFVLTLIGRGNYLLVPPKAIWWNVLNFKVTYDYRKYIQKNRNVSDFTILKKYIANPRASYYPSLFNGLSNYRDSAIPKSKI